MAQIRPGKSLFREDLNWRPLKFSKTHDVSGNSFVSNRKGRKLGAAFNTGACVSDPHGSNCPNDGNLVHQCSRCLDTSHGAHVCPRTDFPANRPYITGTRPKSKGHGKGKGKQKGSGQS